MAQAAVGVSNLSLVNPDVERTMSRGWQTRKCPNWLLTKSSAMCTDGNYGNVAAFSKDSFGAVMQSSFLLVINATGKLSHGRVGIVAKDFPKVKNKDVRAHADYGFWSKPGNKLIGMSSAMYNMSVSLSGCVLVNGRTMAPGDDDLKCSEEIQMRVDVGRNEVRFTAPRLWGSRSIVERITWSGELRLAITAEQGFAFDLSRIETRYTMRDEVPINMLGLSGVDLKRAAKKKCKRVVRKIRTMTAECPINIVVIGEFGSGKSSFINLLMSLFSPFSIRPKRTAFVSQNTEDQGTSRVTKYTLSESNLHLYDSIGIGFTEVGGTSARMEMNYSGVFEDLLRGNISEGFKWENLQTTQVSAPAWKIRTQLGESDQKEDPEGYIMQEDLDIDRMNHGAFLLASPTNNGVRRDPFFLIKKFCADTAGYPVIGIVTQLDKNERHFDVRDMYTNARIGERFDETRKRMEVHAFPARCYTEMDNKQVRLYNLLAAEALDALFDEAIEYKRRFAARNGLEVNIPEEAAVESDDDDDIDDDDDF